MKAFHQMAAVVALFTIAAFLLSSLAAELSGDPALIARVKKAIVYGLAILVVCMPLLVISGKKLAVSYPGHPLLDRKIRRMKQIGVNAVLFLIPLAFILEYLAGSARLDLNFYAFQALEFVCGGLNLFWLSKMVADGRAFNREKVISGS